MVAGVVPKAVLAQSPPCAVSWDPRDTVSRYDSTSTGCYRFRIINRNGSPITGIDISTYLASATLQWLCSVSQDTIGTKDHSTGHFYANTWNQNTTAGPPFTYHLTQPVGGDSSSLKACDSGWVQLCICCTDPQHTLTIPLVFTFHHALSSEDNTDTVTQSFTTTSCHPGTPWTCWQHCDDISANASTDPITGEQKLCVTITQKAAGTLFDGTVSFSCGGGGSMRNWRLDGAPPAGFSVGGIGTGGFSFSANGLSNGDANCGSLTFCFRSEQCRGVYCTNLILTLHTDSDSTGCASSTSVTLPPIDNGCCASAGLIGTTPPSQDPISGIWSYCVVVHRSDALPMSHITIGKTAGRCIQLTSVPDGWTLDGGTTWSFTRTTAPNDGCRTFVFCFQTCDCKPMPSNVMLSVSGENLITATPTVNFPPDGGTCCGGTHRYLKDHVIVTYDPTHANCLTYSLYDTHFPCSNLNDFHFQIPYPCTPSSVSVPTGFIWSYDPVNHQIDVVPSLDQGGVITCCGAMAVTVCFADCIGPFPPFPFHWQSTYNGVVVTDSTQTWPTTGITAAHPLGVNASKPLQPSDNGEQNFPNPFGTESGFRTSIPFATVTTGTAQITIVDEAGKVVLRQDQAVSYSGKHFFYFTGERLPAGRYFYQIAFPKGAKVIVNRTMILVK